MCVIVNTKLGENRGMKRVWLEGEKLVKQGYSPGQRYDLEFKDSKVVANIKPNGKYGVSKRTRNGNVKPLIEIKVSELAEIFKGVDMLRVVINKSKIIITPHFQQERINQRVERILKKLVNGEKLDVASLCHGGGVLDSAIHKGLKSAGVKSSISVAVEKESKYLDSSLRNNPELWDSTSIVIESPLEHVNLVKSTPEVDIVISGLPCVGASKAGRSKNKTWGETTGGYAESHNSAGVLFYSFLQFIQSTNAAVILLENVQEYATSVSMEIIRSVLISQGYHVKERTLEGNEFGALERRKRLAVVAMSVGLDDFDLKSIEPLREKENTVSEILEDVPESSSRWKEFSYLAEKELRDKAAKKGFMRQLLNGCESFIGTIGAGYAKCRSTEPFIVSKFNDTLSRILTPIEHCRVKCVPTHIIEGLSDTVAHQVLGQSIIYPAFEALGYALGNNLLTNISNKSA